SPPGIRTRRSAGSSASRLGRPRPTRTSCAESSGWHAGARFPRHTERSPGRTRSKRASSRSPSCSGTDGTRTCAAGCAGAGLLSTRGIAGTLLPAGSDMANGRQQLDLQLEDPRAQRHIIERPRLTKLLDVADARVVLLVGPAGYGKTTLAREWTSKRGRRGLWYRARMGASDVAAVAQALSKALGPLSPSIERTARELLKA